MSIRLCIGEYAQTGYEPENLGIRVYSLEELCFFIRENAFLLDEGFVDEALGMWLSEECGLQELGEELRKTARRKASLRTFVGVILKYACFFSTEVNSEIENIVMENSRLSIYEKKKARADALMQKESYGLAQKEYHSLLQILPEEEQKLQGDIYHGLGVCLARMFYFSMAGEYFLRAYDRTGRIESYQQYLWTKRLSMTEAEYLEFLREHQEAYEDSLEMEEKLENFKEVWKQERTGLLLHEIQKEKEMRNIAAYQNKLDQVVDCLKELYCETIK